jgi:hypothetical protein
VRGVDGSDSTGVSADDEAHAHAFKGYVVSALLTPTRSVRAVCWQRLGAATRRRLQHRRRACDAPFKRLLPR